MLFKHFFFYDWKQGLYKGLHRIIKLEVTTHFSKSIEKFIVLVNTRPQQCLYALSNTRVFNFCVQDVCTELIFVKSFKKCTGTSGPKETRGTKVPGT